MMRSQFKSPVNVDGQGNVSAEGDFSWELDEEKAVVEVSMFQEWQPGKLTKVGAGKGVFLKAEHPQGWSLTVESESGSSKLITGKVLAAGVVCALGKEIEMRQFIWSEEVELT